MIRGVHTLFYTSEAEALRAFLRDKLGFPYTDVGGGWLIFDLPEADMGCHPTGPHEPPAGTHYISFYCDDIEQTVAELKARGVEFVDGISDAGYGLAIHFVMPGNVRVELSSRAIPSIQRRRMSTTKFARFPCRVTPQSWRRRIEGLQAVLSRASSQRRRGEGEGARWYRRPNTLAPSPSSSPARNRCAGEGSLQSFQSG